MLRGEHKPQKQNAILLALGHQMFFLSTILIYFLSIAEIPSGKVGHFLVILLEGTLLRSNNLELKERRI